MSVLLSPLPFFHPPPLSLSLHAIAHSLSLSLALTSALSLSPSLSLCTRTRNTLADACPCAMHRCDAQVRSLFPHLLPPSSLCLLTYFPLLLIYLTLPHTLVPSLPSRLKRTRTQNAHTSKHEKYLRWCRGTRTHKRIYTLLSQSLFFTPSKRKIEHRHKWCLRVYATFKSTSATLYILDRFLTRTLLLHY
jgi:hypothetical protein